MSMKRIEMMQLTRNHMKLRNILSITIALHVFGIAAMSPEEKVTFKAQLKVARTSDEMEQIVKNKRQGFRLFCIEFSNNLLEPLKFQKKYNNDPIEVDVIRVVQECFYEEMQPLTANGPIAEDVKNGMLARYQRYIWLNPEVVNELTNIFDANDNRLKALKLRYIRLQGVEERRQIDQNFQRDMQALRRGQLKNRIFIGVVLGGIIMLLVWKVFGTKQGEQNDKGGEDEQEVIKSDDGQDTLKGTAR